MCNTVTPELSISDTKPKSTTVFYGLHCYRQYLSTNQQARKSLSHCKKSIVTNYFITLAKGSCNKTVISLGSVGSAVPRSAVRQISLTLLKAGGFPVFAVFKDELATRKSLKAFFLQPKL